MKLITVKDIMAWSPCGQYSQSRVETLIGSGKTPVEILALDIPLKDRLWAILRKEVFPGVSLRLIACDLGEAVLPIWENWAKDHVPEHLDAPRRAIETAVLYADGLADEEKLSAAMAARAARDAMAAGLTEAEIVEIIKKYLAKAKGE